MFPKGQVRTCEDNKENHTSGKYSVLVSKIKEIESCYNFSTDLVSIIDSNYNFVYANGAFLKAYQYSLLELLNINFPHIFIGCNISIKYLKQELRGKNFLILQKTSSLKKNNTIIIVQLKIIPIVGEDYEVFGFQIIATEKPTEEKTEELFASLIKDLTRTFERLPEVYIEIDENGEIKSLKYSDWREENYIRTIDLKGNIISLFDQSLFNNIIKSIKSLKTENENISISSSINIGNFPRYIEVEILSTKCNNFLIVLKDITKLKNSENAIKKTATRFQALWNYSVNGLRLLDKSGIIVAANPAFCKLVEMSSKELLGKPFSIIYDIHNSSGSQESIEKIEDILKERKYETTFEGEIKLSCKKKKYFEITSTLIESTTDVPLFEKDTLIFSIFRDITEKKNSEEEIIKLSHAVESSGEIIFTTNTDGIITYINPAFTKIYGYTKDEIIGKVTPRILKSGMTNPDLHDLFWKTLLAGNSVKSEVINKNKNGDNIYIEGTADPINNEKGEVTGFLAVQRDISERKQAENALMFSESRFRNIWEQSNDGMRLTDENGIMVAVNKAFCKLVNMAEEELINQPFYIIYKMNEAERVNNLKLYKKIFSEQKIQKHRHEYLHLHNGKEVFLYVTFTFLEIKEDQTLLFSIFRDDTQYKRNEEELLKAERLASIGAMTAYLSHEIKNPLAALKNYIELLYENNEISNNSRDTLDLMHDAIDHLNRLIKDVLNYSQSKELIEVEIDLNKIIEKVHELLKKKIDAQKIVFINKVNEIKIYGDYINLLSVFTNLIENSIEAVSLGGTIELSSIEDNDYYSVCIKDTGNGIIQKDKIFNPFFTTKSNGTGLGLCIVKKIMEYHKGSINLKSSEPGMTIFELKFRRKDTDGENTYNR